MKKFTDVEKGILRFYLKGCVEETPDIGIQFDNQKELYKFDPDEVKRALSSLIEQQFLEINSIGFYVLKRGKNYREFLKIFRRRILWMKLLKFVKKSWKFIVEHAVTIFTSVVTSAVTTYLVK